MKSRNAEEKLQYLMDRTEIMDVIYRYARGLDRHDDDLLESVFHEDAVDQHGKWVGGREEFVRWANHEAHNEIAAHTHSMTTHTCEIDGDTAHAESYVMYALRRRESDKVVVGGGRYLDRLERRDGEWRIAARRLITDWRLIADAPPPLKDGVFDFAGTQDRTDPSYQRPLQIGGKSAGSSA